MIDDINENKIDIDNHDLSSLKKYKELKKTTL